MLVSALWCFAHRKPGQEPDTSLLTFWGTKRTELLLLWKWWVWSLNFTTQDIITTPCDFLVIKHNITYPIIKLKQLTLSNNRKPLWLPSHELPDKIESLFCAKICFINNCRHNLFSDLKALNRCIPIKMTIFHFPPYKGDIFMYSQWEPLITAFFFFFGVYFW